MPLLLLKGRTLPQVCNQQAPYSEELSGITLVRIVINVKEVMATYCPRTVPRQDRRKLVSAAVVGAVALVATAEAAFKHNGPTKRIKERANMAH